MNAHSIKEGILDNTFEEVGDVHRGRKYRYKLVSRDSEEDIFRINDMVTGEEKKVIQNKMIKEISGCYCWEFVEVDN